MRIAQICPVLFVLVACQQTKTIDRDKSMNDPARQGSLTRGPNSVLGLKWGVSMHEAEQTIAELQMSARLAAIQKFLATYPDAPRERARLEAEARDQVSNQTKCKKYPDEGAGLCTLTSLTVLTPERDKTISDEVDLWFTTPDVESKISEPGLTRIEFALPNRWQHSLFRSATIERFGPATGKDLVRSVEEDGDICEGELLVWETTTAYIEIREFSEFDCRVGKAFIMDPLLALSQNRRYKLEAQMVAKQLFPDAR